ELAAGVRAASQDRGELAVGAVVGSNIANVSLILAVTALIYPVRVRSAIIRREAPIMLGVSILGAVFLLGGVVSRVEGAVLLGGLVLFVWATWLSARGKEDPAAAADWVEERPPGLGRAMRLGAPLAIGAAIVVGLVLLAAGAELV